jgi:hypothetical protein
MEIIVMSSVVSGFSGGMQSYAEGILQGRMYERQAEAVGTEAAYAEEQSRKQTKQLLGRQRSLYAKAGVSIGEGSPLEIIASTAGEGEREALMIRREGEEEKKLLRWYAKIARKAGRMAFYSGMTSGTVGLSGMVAGGVAGGATGGLSGGISGALQGGQGGGAQGWTSFTRWMQSR